MQPATIIPEIALVSLIKGVCNAAETFQITRYPVNIAKTKIPNLNVKLSPPYHPRQTQKAVLIANTIKEVTKWGSISGALTGTG